MKLLKREKLLEKEKLEVVQVDLGDGEGVYVRQMTGRERDQWEKSLIRPIRDKKGQVTGMDSALEDFRAKLCVHTVCDEKGTLLFSSTDVAQLSLNMSASRLEIIVDAAQKLNKISEEDKEELVKNLDADQVGNSSSDSAKS